MWKAHKPLREIASFAALVLVLLAARSSLANHYVVPTGSMRPTIAVGDRIVVNHLAYGLRLPFTTTYLTDFNGPKRSEVVVLQSPEDGRTLLKRVVGLPGDEIAVRMGRLIINGEVTPIEWNQGHLIEHLGDAAHTVLLSRGGGPAFGPLRLPDERYLVMGDNRGDSRDGRVFGLIAPESILGRARAVFYSDGFVWRPLLF